MKTKNIELLIEKDEEEDYYYEEEFLEEDETEYVSCRDCGKVFVEDTDLTAAKEHYDQKNDVSFWICKDCTSKQ